MMPILIIVFFIASFYFHILFNSNHALSVVTDPFSIGDFVLRYIGNSLTSPISDAKIKRGALFLP